MLLKLEVMLLLKIALCDDESNQLDTINALIFEYFGSSASVQTYNNAKALLEHIEWNEKEVYDLYILDVIMPKISGIELGCKLRKLGVKAPIIYLSKSKDFAVDSYDVKAFYYLIKPIEKDKFFSVLSQADKWIKEIRSSTSAINTPDGSIAVRNSDILYVELYSRCVRYYLVNGSVIDSQKLRTSFRKAVSRLLENDNFILLGASFLINLHHVSKIGKSELHFTNGKTLSLPRNSRNNLLKAWMDYWIDYKIVK